MIVLSIVTLIDFFLFVLSCGDYHYDSDDDFGVSSDFASLGGDCDYGCGSSGGFFGDCVSDFECDCGDVVVI